MEKKFNSKVFLLIWGILCGMTGLTFICTGNPTAGYTNMFISVLDIILYCIFSSFKPPYNKKIYIKSLCSVMAENWGGPNRTTEKLRRELEENNDLELEENQVYNPIRRNLYIDIADGLKKKYESSPLLTKRVILSMNHIREITFCAETLQQADNLISLIIATKRLIRVDNYVVETSSNDLKSLEVLISLTGLVDRIDYVLNSSENIVTLMKLIKTLDKKSDVPVLKVYIPSEWWELLSQKERQIITSKCLVYCGDVQKALMRHKANCLFRLRSFL